MERSECFQMFVYLLCSHYKTFTLALELFPLLYVFAGGGGRRGTEGSNGGVWWEPRCTLAQQLANKCTGAHGCCQRAEGSFHILEVLL